MKYHYGRHTIIVPMGNFESSQMGSGTINLTLVLRWEVRGQNKLAEGLGSSLGKADPVARIPKSDDTSDHVPLPERPNIAEVSN